MAFDLKTCRAFVSLRRFHGDLGDDDDTCDRGQDDHPKWDANLHISKQLLHLRSS